MKRAVKVDNRSVEERILESLDRKPGNLDDLEKCFDGQWCPVREERVNQIGRIQIEETVARLLKRGLIGAQSKVFFVRSPEPKQFGAEPYVSTSSPRNEHPRQTRIPGT